MYQDPVLSSKHFDMLHTASAIHPDVITERGYSTATTQAEVLAAGYADYQSKYLPGLVIPTYNVWGKLAGYQYRADTPRKDKNGKDCKYDNPDGSTMGLDVHPRILSLLKRADVDLWVTEGMKKIDCAVSHDLCCIGLPGVNQWNKPEEWAEIALQGRNVYICFDNDVAIKTEVRQQLENLRAFLRKQRAKVFVVYIPYDDQTDEKIGLDDFLANGGTVTHLYGYASKHLRQADNPTHCMIARMKRELRGQGDVLDTGAVILHDHIGIAHMDALKDAIKRVRDAFAGVDDARKWACVSLWRQALEIMENDSTPKTKGWISILRNDLFGAYGPQVGQWTSIITYFGEDGSRPRLPFWLHDFLYRQKNLTKPQTKQIFDAYEAQAMKKPEVRKMIEDLTGLPATERDTSRKQTKMGFESMPEFAERVQAGRRECAKDGRGEEFQARLKVIEAEMEALIKWALDTKTTALPFAAAKTSEVPEEKDSALCQERTDTSTPSPRCAPILAKTSDTEHQRRDADPDAEVQADEDPDLDDDEEATEILDEDTAPPQDLRDPNDPLYWEFAMLIDQADGETLPRRLNSSVISAFHQRLRDRLIALDTEYIAYVRTLEETKSCHRTFTATPSVPTLAASQPCARA